MELVRNTGFTDHHKIRHKGKQLECCCSIWAPDSHQYIFSILMKSMIISYSINDFQVKSLSNIIQPTEYLTHH